MYGKITLNAILIILLSVSQISFVSGLPGWFADINLPIMVLVFMLALSGFRLALFWSFGMGLLLDIYSFLPFGIYMAVFPSIAILINFFLIHFFTNRSLYSFLALAALALLLHEILVYSLSYAVYFVNRQDLNVYFDGKFWSDQAGVFIMNLGAVFILFYLFTLAGKNLKPVFLIRR
ncbi:rod shape-determining protein MreD [Candidatus Falkowbacteria bacterium RIFOXYB2_FULL_47_14]|uniref:Rod shape-determining protein MreD n=1 Tax=Candidatus Falkowbacteria bacterium RIFOXYA2_FULL_47_19 TaxID=1797994 RepID=A0A1F5SI50_9BACT|nr:MAG: rod shape-determining protein MreD [Candidatus Falkowbacteria bacterium RIFOXYA2_FULL_47_19]OGF34337.1 MAG: rod shape-determining protein MreD [Candidatus Falkowbacteria bacterium RIFOXYC2_FULL_46_15]OGF42726.1 MAG: rod shape-determining protein MreD [Candidatus Falkowbacteria bacterium RIFOXYB2_FULL_47_14]